MTSSASHSCSIFPQLSHAASVNSNPRWVTVFSEDEDLKPVAQLAYVTFSKT